MRPLRQLCRGEMLEWAFGTGASPAVSSSFGETLCLLQYSTELHVKFVPGAENRIADLISRQDGVMTAELRQLFPEANEAPLRVISPDQLFL